MKRSVKLRIGVFCTALLLVAGGYFLNTRLQLSSASSRLEYTYRRALNDLTDHVSGMRFSLRKSAYVNTAGLRGSVSAQLLEQSGGAKAAMAALPFPQEKTERISRFLSQVGDYAMFLTRKTVDGKGLQEPEIENLGVLQSYADRLTEALVSVQQQLREDGSSLERTKDLLNNVDAPDASGESYSGLDEAAEAFAEFPTLLYDGPFSDHVSRRKPLSLEGKREVTREEAAREAAGLLRCSPEELEDGGESDRELPVFQFSHGDSRISITKTGGETAHFKRSVTVSEGVLSREEALEKAREAARRSGLGELRESYYVLSDNLCTVNFASVTQTKGEETEGGQEVICYPDLIKVTVELEKGGTVEYDAAGYLMNHRERELTDPALSADEARKNISPLLTVKSWALALIPTPGLDEVLCWEYLCEDPEGGEVLVYLNASGGLEEQLFLLQKDDHGVLVI